LNIKAKGFAVFSAIAIALAGSIAAWGGTKPKSMRLYVMDCGNIDILDISVFQPGIGQGQQKKLSNPCFFIVHPKGTMLWDAGLPDSLGSLQNGLPVYGIAVFHVTKTLSSQLKEVGYTPDMIDYLALSHMHPGHVGNADQFPRSTLLIQKKEYKAAFGPNPGAFGMDPSTYPTLKKNPVKMLNGDYDVFGDGKVVIKSEPGHTPGHQSLYLELPKSGNIFLSGDVAHYTENWIYLRVPSLNFDLQESRDSMSKVAVFIKEKNATLWIQHDLEQNSQLKHSPAFYE
jgi:glyoxylase-like metal-dependent hydrolase (beta-lactamase superfamily II)